MKIRRLLQSVLLLAVSLTACDSPPAPVSPVSTTPVLTATPAGEPPTTAMYAAVADAFFAGDAPRLSLSLAKHQAVYIQPTWDRPPAPVPVEILRLLATYTTARGLAQVPQEDRDGVVLMVSPPRHQTVQGKHALTISFSIYTPVNSCASLQGNSYRLVATLVGWQAQQYGSVAC